MKYREITIETTEQGIEVVIARLDMIGVQQVNIVQGRNEIEGLLHSAEKYWDYAEEAALDNHPAVKAYISELNESERIENEIKASLAELDALRSEIGFDLGSLAFSAQTVDEEDWANNWKAFFKPFNVGEKLLVCPSWEEVPQDNNRKVLRIDPGMAFGTGTHHTTRMCLEFLEKQLKQGDIVADLGCGSGILSIAASLMGAKKTDAIDIDPVAARVAVENAELNGVDLNNYSVMIGDILSDEEFRASVANEGYDIVLANIVANVIIAFAPVIPQMLKKGGALITSGIIGERLDEVVAALKENGLEISSVAADEDWRAILAFKR